MSKFDEVTTLLKNIPYMNELRGKAIRELIHEAGARNILELGFFQGKSSCYIGAVLEDLGEGHLTTIDKEIAKQRQPPIEENLAKIGIAHRVTTVYAKRSFTWELSRMLRRENPPQFDFCYLDGGHTWDTTGFAFLLVDMMLKPGGVIVLDDLDWTIAGHLKHTPQRASHYAEYDQDEIDAAGVRLVWNAIVPHLGYERREITNVQWGVARKPAAR